MDFVQVNIPYSEVLSNPQIQQLAIAAVLGGAKVDGTTNGITSYINISNNSNTYDMLTYAVVAYIVSLGGEVYNYQSYIAVDLDANVPSYIRDYEVTTADELGTETTNPVTWREWLAVGQSSTNIEGVDYISGFAHYSGFKSSEKPQKHLTGTELSALIASGYNVLNKEVFSSML